MIVIDTNVIAYLWIPDVHTEVAERVLNKDAEWRTRSSARATRPPRCGCGGAGWRSSEARPASLRAACVGAPRYEASGVVRERRWTKPPRYLLKHKRHLRYDEYLAKGYPIATGVIEGACRHLLVDRLDITGARWGLLGAEAVIKLRALRSSGDFEEYWSFHESQEHRRNHASKYAGGRTPKVHDPLCSRHIHLVQ